MLLVVDMGNTNITLGVFEDKDLLFQSRVATDRTKLRDQYAVELMNILALHHTDPQTIDGAIISSVVPHLNHTMSSAIEQVIGVTPLTVGPGIKTGINIRIDDPSTLGADLLVGAVAAVAEVGAPCIIWDLGTATTVSYVDKEGAFRGVSIMPGVITGLASLTQRASLLPSISVDAPKKVIGTNTVHSLQSGAVYGTAAMIDGMNARIIEEIGCDAPVVLTGGLGRHIIGECRHNIRYVDELLLIGLRLIYEKNKK